jgi:hypothetical protein
LLLFHFIMLFDFRPMDEVEEFFRIFSTAISIGERIDVFPMIVD